MKRSNLLFAFSLMLLPLVSLAQTVTNGSITGSPPANSGINSGNAAGWSGCGFSPDLCFTTLPSYLTTSAVTPAVSPDGGTWLGIAALGECAQTTVTGLTIGNVYTLYFCGACFGTGALYNSAPATPQIIIGATTYTPSIPMVASTWNSYSTTFTATAATMTLQCRHNSGSNAYASLDGFNLAGPCGAVLPATIANFLVRPEFSTVTVNWTVSAAEEPFSIEVQRCIHGGDWESIAWFQDINPSPSQDFRWVDTQPFRGQSFYRLAFRDVNGILSHSTLQEVNMHTTSADPLLYPNPASDVLYLSLPGSEPAQIDIYDQEGQQIKVQTTPQEHLTAISLQGINAGMYFVRITTHGEVIRRIIQVE